MKQNNGFGSEEVAKLAVFVIFILQVLGGLAGFVEIIVSYLTRRCFCCQFQAVL